MKLSKKSANKLSLIFKIKLKTCKLLPARKTQLTKTNNLSCNKISNKRGDSKMMANAVDIYNSLFLFSALPNYPKCSLSFFSPLPKNNYIFILSEVSSQLVLSLLMAKFTDNLLQISQQVCKCADTSYDVYGNAYQFL